MTLGLGHQTQYLNWRRVVDARPDSVTPTWVPVSATVDAPLLKKLPLLSANTRRTLSDWTAMRGGLKRGPFDAVLLNPHGLAVKHQDALSKQPAFLCLDATRRQFEALGWYVPKTDRGLMESLRHRRQQRALQAATGLFPVSDWAAQSLIEDYGADPARVHKLPIGIDPELWCPPQQAPADDGVVRLLFVGGAFRRKGGDLLLRWAAQTSRKNWELHIVTGQGNAAVPGVVYHQASNNSRALIELAQRCHLFVLPTRADCSSIAALEAMATGLPVLSTRTGGIPELIVEGKTGHVIAADSYDALHQRLDAMLEKPSLLAQMGRAARERVVAEFDSRVIIRRGLGIIAAAC